MKTMTESKLKAERQQQTDEQETLLKYFRPGEVYAVWSPYNEFQAAEQLQMLLKNNSQLSQD